MLALPATRATLRRSLGLSFAVAALAVVVLALPNFSSAAFGGQNGKVFYDKDGDIWSVNPDGTGAVDLTPGISTWAERRPSPSADGRHVVFQAFRRGGWEPGQGWNIFSMNADGSNQVNLTNTEEPVINFEPSFSPDGSKIVFMRQSGGRADQDIWIINADGTGAVNLSNSPGLNQTEPEFSPDGTKIVYISTDPNPSGTEDHPPSAYPGFGNDVWVMNADGSSPKQLTPTNSRVHNISPTWSPDSTKIAYSTVECPPLSPLATQEEKDKAGFCPEPVVNGLHVMNADGAEETLLLNEGNPIRSAQLSWSPDGTRIAFDSWVVGGIIYTVGATGGATTLLVANAGATYPSWAPTPPPSGKGTPPESEEGTPGSPSPGGSANTPPVVTPGPAPPARRKPLKCGKGKKKKVVKGKVKCVKKRRAGTRSST